MKSLLEELQKNKILVSDGAWGTMLQKMGLESDECPEAWNLSHPEQVKNIAKSYRVAGADIVLTNSFGGNRFKLDHYDLAHKTVEINKAAALLSKLAVGKDIYILGSIGPTGRMLMMADVTEDEWLECFGEQAKALINGGVDGL